jgi:hypothetical protein
MAWIFPLPGTGKKDIFMDFHFSRQQTDSFQEVASDIS